MESKTFLKEHVNDLINQLELASAIIKRQHQILVDHNINPLTGNKNILTDSKKLLITSKQ